MFPFKRAHFFEECDLGKKERKKQTNKQRKKERQKMIKK